MRRYTIYNRLVSQCVHLDENITRNILNTITLSDRFVAKSLGTLYQADDSYKPDPRSFLDILSTMSLYLNDAKRKKVIAYFNRDPFDYHGNYTGGTAKDGRRWGCSKLSPIIAKPAFAWILLTFAIQMPAEKITGAHNLLDLLIEANGENQFIDHLAAITNCGELKSQVKQSLIGSWSQYVKTKQRSIVQTMMKLTTTTTQYDLPIHYRSDGSITLDPSFFPLCVTVGRSHQWFFQARGQASVVSAETVENASAVIAEAVPDGDDGTKSDVVLCAVAAPSAPTLPAVDPESVAPSAPCASRMPSNTTSSFSLSIFPVMGAGRRRQTENQDYLHKRAP